MEDRPMERSVLVRSKVRRIPSRRRRSSSGFTLIELAVVVTIVAILSVIAVVGYRKYMLNAHITEARQMISAIRIAQEDHMSEKGSYANIGTNFCPAGAGKGTTKVGWDPGCNGGVAKWNTLAVHADGPVQFAYATIAATTKPADPPFTGFEGVVSFAAVADKANYVVGAKCDLDNDSGTHDTILVGSSYENVIHSAYEGN
jgi:prepilin-type N-terminal cleavage/methylation domain-containing protein